MKLWGTEIKALCPYTGEMKTRGGDYVQAPTLDSRNNCAMQTRAI